MSSGSILMFFSFHNKKPFGYVMNILSCTNLRWEILLQYPSDAIQKMVSHHCHYDSKRILSWDSIKISHYNLSFSLHKAFWHKSRLATLYVPSGVTFKSCRPNIVYCLGSIKILFYVPKQVLELLSLMTTSMNETPQFQPFIQRLNIWWDNCSAWIIGVCKDHRGVRP